MGIISSLNTTWRKMSTGTKMWIILGWARNHLSLQHKCSLSLAQDMRKIELTVYTHMLSLLLQTPRDRDAMALPPLPLHQPSKKGGCVGWQTGSNTLRRLHTLDTTLPLSCRDSYLETGWRGRWLWRQSVGLEHTQDNGLVLLCVCGSRARGVGVCMCMWMIH